MASEIRVNKIENRSGLGTVTFADTGVDLAGIVTATTFSGSGASLTSLPAAQVTGTLPAISGANLTNLTAANLTGALPAISGANLTGIAATDNVRTGILDVAGIATFRNDVNVGAAVTISESGIEASGIGITVANINGGQIGGRRNIIINGAMLVAQRGASGGTTSGYACIDRFAVDHSGTDEAPTQSQVDVSSGTGPYTEGFRKAFKITNGNQTSGTGVTDYIGFRQTIEAQDLANSGWNYTSSSSYLTLSFWIKSSVAQSFEFNFRTEDGTNYQYLMSTGSLSADTWTKVIKTIPGNSNLTFNNDTGVGANIYLLPFAGTQYTNSVDSTHDAWQVYNSGYLFGKDATTTWYTTNDATLEITGVQLEVGSQATPFEHRSFGEEFDLCQRYYMRYSAEGVQYHRFAQGQMVSANGMQCTFHWNKKMRTTPTLGQNGTFGTYVTNAVASVGTLVMLDISSRGAIITGTSGGSYSAGQCVDLIGNNDTDAYLEFIAEL